MARVRREVGRRWLSLCNGTERACRDSGTRDLRLGGRGSQRGDDDGAGTGDWARRSWRSSIDYWIIEFDSGVGNEGGGRKRSCGWCSLHHLKEEKRFEATTDVWTDGKRRASGSGRNWLGMDGANGEETVDGEGWQRTADGQPRLPHDQTGRRGETRKGPLNSLRRCGR